MGDSGSTAGQSSNKDAWRGESPQRDGVRAVRSAGGKGGEAAPSLTAHWRMSSQHSPQLVAVLLLIGGAACAAALVAFLDASATVRPWLGGLALGLCALAIYAVLRLARVAKLTIEAQRRLVDAGFEAADAIVILRTADGRLLQANSVAERVSGYSSRELADPTIWRAMFMPDDIRAEEIVEARAFESKQPIFREIPWIAKNGERRLIRWSNVALRRANGDQPALLKVGLDLTELRHHEVSLLRNETYLRLAHRLAKLCHWHWRSDGGEWHLNPTNQPGHFVYSDEIYDIFGYRPDEVPDQIDTFADKIVHPDDSDHVRSLYAAFIDTGESVYSVEYRAHHRDGRILHIRETGVRLRDDTGTVTQIVGTFQDVTEMRASEHSMQRTKAELRRSLRMSGLCNWSWQPSTDSADGLPGTYQSSGDTAELLGLAAEDVALNDFEWHQRIVHPDDAAPSWQRYEDFRWGPATAFTQEYRILSRHRGMRHIRSICEKTFDANGRLIEVSGALQDVTDQRERELELIKAKNAAEIANRSKTEFLANMSHELRTPLNAVIGFSQVIRDQYFGNAPGRYATYAADIYKSGQLLLKLISDVLDMSKLEAGKVELFEEKIDAAAIAEDCVTMLQARAEEGQVRIERNWTPGLPPITADARAVAQILLNVLTNAVKFSPPNHNVHLSARLSDGGDFLIVIRDAGIGMTKEAMQNLFSAFHQADATISRRFGGTGLGLAITKRLMELHGGSIDLSSEIGQGTRVVLRFPASRVAKREEARNA